MAIPRSEYPRPQWKRDEWLCLNGEWEFQIDNSDSGIHRNFLNRRFENVINVPFCPESALSGIGNTDYMHAVWYRKSVQVPQKWENKRQLLHFQAVDYDATVWVNGVRCARHRGGWTPFTVDLQGLSKPGGNLEIVVRARDNMKEAMPRGKQSADYHNHDCEYTRTTGIWQSVWLEAVNNIYLERPRITPEVSKGGFFIEQKVNGNSSGLKCKVTLSSKQVKITESVAEFDNLNSTVIMVMIPEDKRIFWAPENPHLYDLKFQLLDKNGNTLDSAESYAGFRNIQIDGLTVKLNGKSVFQRLVLDQGYYPDGIMTAPSEKALVEDIKLSKQAGFNGARLHQKVFEERFLYHCDRMGYLLWAEFGDWGLMDKVFDNFYNQPGAAMLSQWTEVLRRDYSHPSIIGWCPLNETREAIEDRYTALEDITRGLFWITKSIDRTRPVIDASGYSHRVIETDIYDSHLYVQDPVLFKKMVRKEQGQKPFINNLSGGDITHDIEAQQVSVKYNGQPFFISEFGGIWWDQQMADGNKINEDKDRNDSWGYGDKPTNIEQFYQRFEGLCRTLLEDKRMFGYCYTQLTDVFQEKNGLYTFDRRPKFDLDRISKIQKSKAAIEAL
jgi:beta-galactosidase/beta-glucuronidase